MFRICELIMRGIILLSLTSIGWALEKENDQPYEITSQRAKYVSEKQEVYYEGTVYVKQGKTELWAEQLWINFDKKTGKILRLIAKGAPARYVSLPDPKKGMLQASANTIQYYPQTAQVRLIQNGFVTQDKNVFKGPDIWYDIKRELVVSKASGSTKQTTIVIQPQEAV